MDDILHNRTKTYLDSFVIIHNPSFMIMTIGKTMIMLPIVANLSFKKNMNNITKSNLANNVQQSPLSEF